MSSVLVRVDASPHIGAGHFMRCVSLADGLQSHGWTTTFVSQPLPSVYIDLLVNKNHSLIVMPDSMHSESQPQASDHSYAAWIPWREQQDAEWCVRQFVDKSFDWVVVDHYSLGFDWECAIRRIASKVMVIDDLVTRNHDCDLLLNQNYGQTTFSYKNRVASSTRLLIGPHFALLRPEFANLREATLSSKTKLDDPILLISLGGVDKDNFTQKVLCALAKARLPSNVLIVVVLGPDSPHIDSVRAEADKLQWKTKILVNVTDMARLMTEASWAIGAAGSSTWERCCLGLPTLTLVIAENQLPSAHALAESGYTIYLDPLIPINTSIPQGIEKLISHAKLLSIRCAELTDGRGVERVFNAMRRLSKQ